MTSLWPHLETDIYDMSHDRLAECCKRHLNTIKASPARSRSGSPFSSSLPIPGNFSHYSAQYILYHANQAAMTSSSEDYLRSVLDKRNDRITPCQYSDLDTTWYDHPGLDDNAAILCVLAFRGYSNLVRYMCRNGPLIGKRGNAGTYPLMTAIAHGHLSTVAELLQISQPRLSECLGRGADHQLSEDHPLIWALRQGLTEIAECLLAAKDLRIDDLNTLAGRNVLSFAAEVGCEAVAHWVAERGQLVAMANAPDNDNLMPLVYAAGDGHRMTLGLLLGVGAPAEQVCLALHRASWYLDVLTSLLHEGANVDAANIGRLTALMSALAGCKRDCMKILLQSSTDKEVRFENREASLIFADEVGHESCVESPMNQSVYLEARDDSSMTSILHATKFAHRGCVKMLLNRRAFIDIEHRDKDGMTALMHAAPLVDISYTQLLLQFGADISARDYRGRTATMLAAGCGNIAIVELFLDQGANIDDEDDEGMTALLHATRILRYASREQCVQVLLARSASRAVVTSEGKTYSDLFPDFPD